jgi:hypothetical protein
MVSRTLEYYVALKLSFLRKVPRNNRSFAERLVREGGTQNLEYVMLLSM